MAEARYRGEVVKLDRGYPLVRLEDGELLRCEHATALVKGERRRAVIGDVVEVAVPPAHDKGVIEAAQSMGCSPFQIIWKVILPESLPSLVASFTTAFITILGYGAMAGAIGGGGLGKIAINYGYYRFNVVLEFFATALLVVLVQILQTFGTRLAVGCDKRVQK